MGKKYECIAGFISSKRNRYVVRQEITESEYFSLSKDEKCHFKEVPAKGFLDQFLENIQRDDRAENEDKN